MVKTIVNAGQSSYEEVKVIGQGSFGVASLVRRVGDNELFVLKRLFTRDLPDKEKQDFDKEVNLLKQLGERSHPNIVRYYDSFERDGEMCIVTDYAEGGDLSRIMSEYKASEVKDLSVCGLPQRDVVDLFAQLCSAVKLLHEFRILHRDLKPGNVFVSDKYGLRRLQLGDFGISRQLGSGTDFAATVTGTPFYFSPEVCAGQKYDGKSDVWSLGCILYEMMMMKRAFNGESLPMVIMSIHRGRCEKIPPDSGYDPALVALVERCMSKSPADRPSVAEVLQEPILAAAERTFRGACQDLGGVEELSPHVSTRSRPRPWSASTQNSSGGRSARPSNASSQGLLGSQTAQLSGSMMAMSVGPAWGAQGTGGFEWGRGNPVPREFQAVIEKLSPAVAPNKVSELALGGSHMLAVVEDGGVWSWMYDMHGDAGPEVLGQGGGTDNLKEPQRIAGLEEMFVRQVACGRDHSLALTAGGKVFSWGGGEYGRLGLGDEEDRTEPCEVTALAGEVINRVACGADHSAALTEGGAIYTWGSGGDAQLGHQDSETREPLDDDALEPVRVVVDVGTKMDGKHIVEVACGDMFTAVVSGDGLVFTWGDNDWGQLGRDDTVRAKDKATGEVTSKNVRCVPGWVRAAKDDRVTRLSCGAAHACAVTEGGEVLTWGSNEYGQVGGPRNAPEGAPKVYRVPAKWQEDGYKPVAQVVCGSLVTIVVTEDGKLYSWGHKGGSGHGREVSKDVREPRLVAGPLGEHAVCRVAAAHVSTESESEEADTAGMVVAIIHGG